MIWVAFRRDWGWTFPDRGTWLGYTFHVTMIQFLLSPSILRRCTMTDNQDFISSIESRIKRLPCELHKLVVQLFEQELRIRIQRTDKVLLIFKTAWTNPNHWIEQPLLHASQQHCNAKRQQTEKSQFYRDTYNGQIECSASNFHCQHYIIKECHKLQGKW